MKISQRLDYACRALAHLAKVHDGKRVTRLEEIARRETISGNFLVQIFNDLRRAGLVDSRRGKTGGYILARPPEHISLRDVVEAVEPQMLNSNSSQEGESGRSVRNAWDDISSKIQRSLDKVSLARLSTFETSGMFHI